MRHPRMALVTAAGAALLLVVGCAGTAPVAERSARHAAPQEYDASGSGADAKSGGGSGGQPAPPPAGSPDAAKEQGLRTDGSDPAIPPGPMRTGDMLSTFGLDVDTASYDYARRTLSDGRLPDPSQVRAEEFVNAFAQDYRQPQGDGIGVHVDGARLPHFLRTQEYPQRIDPKPIDPPEPGTPEADTPAYPLPGSDRLLRVGLQTRDHRYGRRADARLTFVVDVSGSMREPGRLDLVQDALHTLIDQLRQTDAVAIVAYSASARVIRPMTPVWEKADLHRAVDELGPESETNLEAGLVAGYDVAREGFRAGVTNRVILLSDGLANAGNTTHDAILSRIRENAGKDIPLLCVGVGREYGDHLMEQLADNGDGFAVYVQQPEEARRLFVDRLPGTLEVRARDAKVQVEFDPRTVASYRLVGYDNRAVADDDFRNNAADGGEVGPGQSVTALYVVTLRPAAYGNVATATARWQEPRTGAASEAAAAVSVSDLDRSYAAAPPRLRVDYVAAAFAEHLRGGIVVDGGPDGGVGPEGGVGPGMGGSVVGGPVSAVPWEWLAAEADALAVTTEDRDVAALADLLDRAQSLI